MRSEAVCDMGDVVKDHQLLSLNNMLHACTRHITIQLDPSIDRQVWPHLSRAFWLPDIFVIR